MQELINLVSEKTGISTEQAQSAVDTVVSFLKDKLPGGMGSQLESLMQGGGSVSDITSGLTDKIGGMFGN